MAAAAWASWRSSIIVLVIGILACADHVRETGRDDPSECVIDELAGQWLACSFCLLTFGGLLPADAHLPARFRPGLCAVPPVRYLEALAGELGRQQSQRRPGRDDRRHDRRPDGGRAGGRWRAIFFHLLMFAPQLRDQRRDVAGGGARQRPAHRHGGKLHRRTDRRPADRNSRLVRCVRARLCHLFQPGQGRAAGRARAPCCASMARCRKPVARAMAEGALRNSTAQLSRRGHRHCRSRRRHRRKAGRAWCISRRRAPAKPPCTANAASAISAAARSGWRASKRRWRCCSRLFALASQRATAIHESRYIRVRHQLQAEDVSRSRQSHDATAFGYGHQIA